MNFVFFCITVFIFLFDSSMQIPHLINCPPDFLTRVPWAADSCGTLTCEGSDSFHRIGCGTWDCMPGKHIGYKETNNSKPFPDCCGGPICKD